MSRIEPVVSAKTSSASFSIVLIVFLIVFLTCHVGAQAWALPSAALKSKVVGGYDNLAARLKKDGRVKTLVRLNMKFGPSGKISNPDTASQSKRISNVQELLISGLSGIASSSGLSYYKYKYIPYMAMTLDGDTLDPVLSAEEVQSIELDDAFAATSVNWDISATGASNLWSYGYDGSGFAIAVLDTGVDKTHPMLSGKVISEACYSTNDASVHATSTCPGGVTDTTASGAAQPYAGNCPTNQCDHGTSVAGFAAGKNTGQSSGVAKGASIIGMQVFTRFDNGCPSSSLCLYAYNSDIVKGLERVYELSASYPIAAVNLSTSGGYYTVNCDIEYGAIKAMVDVLRSIGIATVSASGNNGYTDGMSGPACISTVVSVGATTSADTVAFFSNSASYLSLLSPGYEIIGPITGGRYMSWDGTSMASPHVAGAWAILKQARPWATVPDILYSLVSTGVPVSDYRSGLYKPRLNISSAIQTLAGSLVYYMPFFTTDNATPTFCWISNKGAAPVTASIQIMSSSSPAPPTQIPLSTTISFAAKSSKMITFSGFTITSSDVVLDLSSEIGQGASTAYSADMTFSSNVATSCNQLEMSCFQGTTSPKRSLVGYTCYDGTVRSY